MRIGARLLQVATAALYLGPLLAGLAGYGWAMLPPFISIFVLWLVVTRPQQWPQTHAEWLTRDAWIAALTQILAQTALVALCFGIGRGIGGIAGTVPMLHPILPVALSFGALALARAVWDPARALAEGRTIDELLYPATQPPADRRAAAGDMVALAVLFDLPDEAPQAEVLPLVAETLEDTDPYARLAELVDTLSALPATRHAALRQALIHWATDPEPFAAGTAPGGLRAAFAAAGQDARLLEILAPRALALLAAVPERADQFPDPAVIDDIARRGLPRHLSEGLVALAALLRGTKIGAARTRRAPLARGGLQSA